MLTNALAHGYRVASLEEWLTEPAPAERCLVLRHDVDQCPGALRPMLDIEEALYVRSTCYFRWRTADPGLIRDLRRRGFGVGLHYETLSRMVLARGGRGEVDGPVEEARAALREEIQLFQAIHGPIRSVCPHGDSRVRDVRNAELLAGQEWRVFGIEFDANEAMRGRRLACWMTDRSSPEGGWVDRADPADLFDRGLAPILCLTHPNNWISGAGLWRDRLLRAALPAPRHGEPRLIGPLRTGGDHPPIDGRAPERRS